MKTEQIQKKFFKYLYFRDFWYCLQYISYEELLQGYKIQRGTLGSFSFSISFTIELLSQIKEWNRKYYSEIHFPKA